MITNLPLLFVKGKPTSLLRMTVQELECFITFLVHCSLGHDTVKNIQQPPWWPTNVPFSAPFISPQIRPRDWDLRLRELVNSCYKHHCSEFLLKFCEELADIPASMLQCVKHSDSTTSLYLKTPHKLLVTFRNENMLYDDPSKRKNLVNSRKSLLPYRQTTTTTESIVESEDAYLYLCDTCDKVFSNLEETQKHEKECSQKESVDLSPDSPDASRIFPEDDQDGFLKLFDLYKTTSDERKNSPAKSDFGPLLRRNGKRFKKTLMFTNLTRYPFSSPAGIKINKSQQMQASADIFPKREQSDRYCATPIDGSESHKWFTRNYTRHFPVKYKKPDDYWERYQIFHHQRNKTILDIDSQLLFLKCKPLRVNLNKLSKKDINDYKVKLKLDTLEEMMKDPLYVDSVNDNDIEFVSHEVLPDESSRKYIMNKGKRRKISQKNVNKNETDCNVSAKLINNDSKKEAPVYVIDLCSDEDDQQDSKPDLSVSCRSSDTIVGQKEEPVNSSNSESTEIKGAQYHISVQSAHISKSNENKPNIDPLYINLYSPNVNNVIALE